MNPALPGPLTRNRLPAWWAVAVVAVPLVVLFWPAICAQGELGYRDVAHYYRPLYALVGREWRAGRVPLWNPYENAGQPLMADSTSAVWYPPQWLFALRLNAAHTLSFYVVGHLLLAAATMFLSARLWRYSRGAAGCAAISYTLGGYVLFQYCNPAYLVGCTWLPLALLAIGKFVERAKWRWGVLLAVALALMVLGGDPQSAYHIMLAGGLFVLVGSHRKGSRWATTRRLAGAALFAGALAAIQILPAIECTRESTRVVHAHPRSVWHLARQPRSAFAKLTELARPGRHGSHDAQVYDFSVGPWRVVECAWPNFSGRTFPVYQRWTREVLGEKQVWNPSLYFGALPFVFAATAVLGGRRRRVTRWWKLLLVFALLASFGEYGLAWVWEGVLERFGHPRGAETLGAVGGLYWWLVVLLPGYSSFRFPAKWLAIAACTASLLAAHGWDEWRTGRSPWPRRLLIGGGAVSLLAFLLAACTATGYSARFADAPADRVFGPMHVAGAVRDVWSSMLHHAMICGAALVAISTLRRKRVALAAVLLALTAADLGIAHAWQIATVRTDDDADSAVCLLFDKPTSADAPPTTRRIYRDRSWRPAQWSHTSSRDRLDAVVRWDRATLFPKYHFDCRSTGVSLLASPGAMYSADHAVAMEVARRETRRRRGKDAVPIEYLEAAAAEYLLLPPTKRGPEKANRLEGAWPASLEVERVRLGGGRARLVREVQLLAPLDRRTDEAAVARRTQAVLMNGEGPRNFARQAVVEADLTTREQQMLAELSAGNPGPSMAEFCRVTLDEPQRVRIQARLNRPALLVLSDTYYPGWKAMIRGPGGKTEVRTPWRTNRWMRGVLLGAAGEYSITYEYRPLSFYGGFVISLVAWCSLATLVIKAALKRRHSN